MKKLEFSNEELEILCILLSGEIKIEQKTLLNKEEELRMKLLRQLRERIYHAL